MSLTPGLHRPEHPEPRPLAGLAAELGYRVVGDATDRYATGIALRTQDVRPGDVFAALPGVKTHGARFARQARDLGAVAVLTDADGAAIAADAGVPVLVTDAPREAVGVTASWILRTPGAVPLLFGVTGTNGKTTTTRLLDFLLRRLGLVTGYSTTVERVVAGERVPSRLTTPEADELHALLARMRERGVEAAVIEVSAQALVRHRVAGIPFDVVGFTNLTHDHLDDFGDMDRYFAAKASLFAPGRAQRGVASLDTPYGRRLADEASIPVTTVGHEATDADWRVEELAAESDGMRFTLAGPAGERLPTRVAQLGAHAAGNAALAIVMALEAGRSLDEIGAALGDEGFTVANPGRLERVPTEQGPSVYLDIAHTPDAIATSLRALRPLTTGRVIIVFGADGDRDPTKRPVMGRLAAELADVVYVTDYHSRSEPPDPIRIAVLEGARAVPGAEVHEVRDPAEGIRRAVREAADGDSVLWAGSGTTEYLDIGGVKHPFSFREHAAAAIRERG